MQFVDLLDQGIDFLCSSVRFCVVAPQRFQEFRQQALALGHGSRRGGIKPLTRCSCREIDASSFRILSMH